MAIWNGVLFGLLLTIFIGPVFFALIQTSIEKGFISGIFMAIGIALSDTVYISITYFGLSQLIDPENVNAGLGVVGGLIMIGFGLVSYFKPINSVEAKEEIQPKQRENFLRPVIKGFLLNGINPSVFVFWIGISSMATVNYGYSGNIAIVFFASIIATVFLTDIVKSFVAHKLKKLLTYKFMSLMNKAVGIALFLFGLRLLYFVFDPM